MKITELWRPPGKNCGLCGQKSCQDFLSAVINKEKHYQDCPFYKVTNDQRKDINKGFYTGIDILQHEYDFVLSPLPGEISARKIILPFRSDLVEKLQIQKGDYVIGRPMGAGCPIPHVLEVIEAESLTGLIYTWVVGPKFSREQEVKELKAYHMIGFEGLASKVIKEPIVGSRVTFLPGFCMMNLNHTGLLNMLFKKTSGFHVRIEDIRIMASS